MQKVLKVGVLGTGKMGKRKDLSEFDTHGVFPVCSGQDPSKVVQERNSGEPATESWAANSNSGPCVPTTSTDELLLLKLLK